MTHSTKKHAKIRVLVIDDSPTARDLLTALYSSEPDMEVVGSGGNGDEAMRLAHRLRPDIISMDVIMPHMDGLEATRRIMRESPTPIVIVTASLMQSDIDITFEALKAGALAAVRKPGLNDNATCQEVVETIRVMSKVRVVHRWGRQERRIDVTPNSGPCIPDIIHSRTDIKIIGIASSTGGPAVLAEILGALPADFPFPLVIVQHVTNGFSAGLAEWLNSQTRLRVTLTQHGDFPRPGTVLLPPDDYHIQIARNGTVELNKQPPYKGLRPSANYLFESLAKVYGARAAGIVLTGMGDDGAAGLETLHLTGGLTIAQDEQSCIVFGMPNEAIQRRAIDCILKPNQIAQALIQLSALPTGK